MQRFFVYCFTVISLTLAGVLLFSTPTHADIIFTADYEGGSLSQWDGYLSCCPYSQQVVTTPVRGGKYAARFELRDSDRIERTEMVYEKQTIGLIGGPDEWYGFSIYLPASHVNDTFPMNYIGLGAFEILAQWHTHPDSGEVWRNPPLFRWSRTMGQWKIRQPV